MAFPRPEPGIKAHFSIVFDWRDLDAFSPDQLRAIMQGIAEMNIALRPPEGSLATPHRQNSATEQEVSRDG